MKRRREPKSGKKRMPMRILSWAGIVLLGLLLASVVGFVTVRTIHRRLIRITGENGIEEERFVSLGGQEQYVLIRGADVRNPVLLWLHGGPASPDAFLNYDFSRHLEQAYTVVFWDQRGCGRTYYRNRAADPDNQTATFDRAQKDLDELVDYLHARFSPQQLVLIGHSYGTVLGSKYALTHPEKIDAFIGVGQVTSLYGGERYSYSDALRRAKEKGDDTAKLEEAFQTAEAEPTLLNWLRLRARVAPYHRAPREKNQLWIGLRSPYLGWDNLRWFLKTQHLDSFIDRNKQLCDYVLTLEDVRTYGTMYAVPVGIVMGENDWVTPEGLAQGYYANIDAPKKTYAAMEGCGHSPQHDDPEAFASTVKAMLKTLLPSEEPTPAG